MSEYFRACLKREYFGIYPTQLKFKSSLKNTIYETLKRRLWKETDGDDFDFHWSERNYFAPDPDTPFHSLYPEQYVNHFPNNYELTRKDSMYKNLKNYKKKLEKEKNIEESNAYDFFPLTFQMPIDFGLFVDEYKHTPGALWIMKPSGKAQGRGIFMVTSLKQMYSWRDSIKNTPEALLTDVYIAQKYILNPLLLGGKKFDCRVYALVTSYKPLVIYLNRTAFARFTTVKYSNNPENLTNNYIHLTNVAVQKTSDTYDKGNGGKWDLRQMKIYLSAKYGEAKVIKMFDDVQNIIVRSILSVQQVISQDRHCFELYGYDILFDSNLKPWLIEINANPSLTANTKHDAEMKIAMLDDMCTILDLEKILTGNEEQIGGFDLIYKQTPIKLKNTCMYKTRLGGYNNREKQLKSLAKQTATRLANLYLQKKQNINNGKKKD